MTCETEVFVSLVTIHYSLIRYEKNSAEGSVNRMVVKCAPCTVKRAYMLSLHRDAQPIGGEQCSQLRAARHKEQCSHLPDSP